MTFRLLAHKTKLTSKDAFLQFSLFTNSFLAAIKSLAFLKNFKIKTIQ